MQPPLCYNGVKRLSDDMRRIGWEVSMSFDAMMIEVEGEAVFERLNAIYDAIPGGKCSGCASCCFDAVQTSFVEYMHIRHHLHNHGLLTQEVVKRLESFGINELTEVAPCPFLTDGACGIYAVRPLTCRLFGFQSRNEQLQRKKVLLAQHKGISHVIYDRYGYKVPDAVMNHVISFCEDFVPDQKLSKRKRALLYDQIMALDAPYFITSRVDESLMQMTLIDWVLKDLGLWDAVEAGKIELVQNLGLIGSKKIK